MALTETQLAALKSIADAAVESERSSGVPAELVASQCVLESAWLTRFSAPHNALGIKAAARHDQTRVSLTKEHESGAMREQLARFAAFESLADCFRDHAFIITTLTRYGAAWQGYLKSKNLESLVRGVAEVYATDPDYASKLLRVQASQPFKNAIAAARGRNAST